MQTTEVHNFARKLLQAHGNRAEFEAAQNAAQCERQGENKEAEMWRRVQASIKTMRGPHAS